MTPEGKTISGWALDVDGGSSYEATESISKLKLTFTTISIQIEFPPFSWLPMVSDAYNLAYTK